MRGKRAPWLLGALFLAVVVTLAGGTPPPRPSSFFGSVKAGGNNAAVGSVVSAWIGGVKYAESTLASADGLSVYRLDVPGDLPGTAAVEGGQPGQTITFKVAGAQVSQTAAWQDGTVVRLDLTAPVGPDLTVSVNDGTTEASPGATLTYTITVLNHGSGSASGILVRDTLSTATSFVSASDGGSAAGGVVAWPAFDLAEGQSVTRTVTARVLSSIPASLASLTNVATASDDGTRGLDPKPADNTVSDVDTLNAFPDLVVDVDNGVSQVAPGQRLEYTITISNTGSREAAGILLRNTLPSGITFFAASDSGAESGNPPNLITWPAFSLAGGATVKRSFTAQVSSTPSVSTLTDTASATEASGTDSHPADNSDTDSDPVIQKPDLTVSSVGTAGAATDAQTLAVSGSIAVGIANGGNLGVSSNFALVVFEDRDGDGAFTAAADNQLGQASVTDPVPVGGNLSVDVPVSGTVLFRDNRISAFVDSGKAIAELDETNNVGTVAQSCAPAPAAGGFKPVLELNWPRPGIVQPTSVDSSSSPVVVHLTDDNGDGKRDAQDVPSIVFTTGNYDPPLTYVPSMLRAIRGDTGAPIFDVPAAFEGGIFYEFSQATVAVGDVDLDGLPDIAVSIVAGSANVTPFNVLALYGHDGRRKWKSAPYSTHPSGTLANRDNPAIADIDRDGKPEIVVGAHVFNSNGTLRWKGTGGQGFQSIFNQNGAASGSISIVADLDLNGDPEIVTGNTAYRSDGSIYWQVPYGDGYPAVGNFDADPFPEIVVVSKGAVRLHEHDGTLIWGPVALPGTQPMAGGAPTIADFDADGQPEIGVAGSNFYTVFETDGTVKWQRSTQDVSSGMTGSTVFDFDGDGRFEVVYRDEVYLRIYRGEDGTELAKFEVGSGTVNEEPVVADVDRDGNAEILVSSDHGYHESGIPGNETNAGLRVFGEADDRWVGTRDIWNQHAYSVGNVNDNSSIPSQPEWSWLTHNSYRSQVAPGRVAFGAPDLSASRLVFDASAYPAVKITARIGNGGGAVARAGLPVAFHLGNPAAGGTLLGTAATSRSLKPGEYEDVALTATLSNPASSTVWVTADDDGTGKGRERECDEANNRTSAGVDLSALGLVLSMSDGQSTVATGETVTYTLSVFNSASHEATGVVLADELPAYTTLVAADAGGSLANGKAVWPAFTLAGGATATRTLTLRVNDSIPSTVTDLINRATVADDGAHGPDPTPANNVATDTNHLSAVRAQAGGPYEINEGGSVTFDASASSARSGSIVSYAWDLNADGVFNDGATARVTKTYADEIGLTVAVKVVGSTGESDVDTATLTVRNVAPVVEAGPDRKVVRGKTLALSATTFTDPGSGDTQTATVEWGDGTAVQPAAVAKNGTSGTVTGAHVYSNDGTYTVKVCVSDNDGGTGCDAFPVKVSDGWILVGQANDVAHPGCIQLTNSPWQTGAAWYSQKLDLLQSFDKTLSVRFGSEDRGADGQVFVLQNAGTGTSAIGGWGVEIGYGKVTPSISVEMDTYSNTGDFGLGYLLVDPVEDHIAVNENGALDHRGSKAVKLLNIEDGQEHQLRVIWNAPAKTLDVHFDGTELLMYPKDIVQKIFNGASQVNWGLTSGTGSEGADNFFCETVACSDAGGPVISVGDVKVTEGATGTVDASFPVTLACVADHEVRVSYSTADGSAHAGEDFEAASGTVIFQPGETSKAVVVPVLADEPGEMPEQFFLDLGQAQGGAVRYGRGVGSIKDFHPPTITFTGTIRDFKLGHPDFERNGLLGGDPGIVLPDLGSDRKPVYAGSAGNPTTTTRENFDQWYRDVPDVNKSKSFSIPLQPRTDDERVFRYSNRSFYPIDGELWDAGSTGHNSLFTYELHARFFYEGGEVLRFFSDDDMWVFVNGKLAVDMGACTCTETPLNLDQSASRLGLVPGRFYDMDVFYAERHSGGAAFQIELPYAVSTQNPGRVQLSTPSAGIAEAGGAATVQVIRDGGSDGPATVSYTTMNGTATAPSDFAATSGTITFKNGESAPKTITIPIVNDAAIEGDETFRIVLSNPSGIILGSVPETVLTIQDDDVPKLPELSASKTAELAGDHDGDGVPSPGDELLYRITIANRGNGSASGVVLNDRIPDHTALVPGSVTASAGTIVTEDPVKVEVGALGAGQTSTVSFRVMVDSPVPAGVKEISNQGTVNSVELPAVFTDDPDLGGASDPTVTMITAAPKLVAEKTWRLAADADQNQVPSPGDTLEYTVAVLNTGNTSATEVVLEDKVPDNTTLVTGEGPVRIAFGEIAGGARIERSFQVVIDDPIAAGVKEIRNQGKVTSHELPVVYTDDPQVGGSADETVTVVSAAPVLRVEKVASLFEDADSDKAVSPGDAVLYSITIANTGNTAATEAVLSDPIADHTAVVAGTVQASQGTVTSESPIGVNLGALAAGATATVSFQVRIDEDFPALEVSNQATMDSHELEPVPSDDPATSEKPDATRTPVFQKPEAAIGDASVIEGDAGLVMLRLPVTLSKPSGREIRIDFATSPGTATAGADYDAASGTLIFAAGETSHIVEVPVHGDFFLEPDETLSVDLSNPAGASIAKGRGTATIQNDDEPAVLVASKTAELAVDHDGDGVPSPGDEIGYRILISNTGGSYATAIVLADDAPVHTKMVAGSVSASFGTVASQDPVRIEMVRLAPGETSTVSFRVIVDNPISAGVREISNQGQVSSAELPGVFTDDPDREGASNPTVTTITAAPKLQVEKTWRLVVDADGDGAASPGDTLEYRVTTLNTGNTAATETVLSDPIPTHTTVVGGSVQTPQGTVASESPVQVKLGSLAAGAPIAVLFQVRIDESFPAAALEVSNQAMVDSLELEPVASDDPATSEKPDATRTQVFHNPKLSVGDASVEEGDSGLVTLRLPVTLSRTSGREVRVDFATAPGTATAGEDYDSVSGTLVFAPGEASDTIEVPVHGDFFLEPDETLSVDLSNPAGASIAKGRGTATIQNDDEPAVLVASKTAELAVDHDGDGVPSPGDEIGYRVLISNTGGSYASAIVLTDQVPPHTRMVTGSVTSSVGTVASEEPVRVELGRFAPEESAAVSFRVIVDSPIAAGVREISNQGRVDSAELPAVLTDDPDLGGASDPTVTMITAAPKLVAEKTWELGVDADQDGVPSPGDTLKYTIRVLNTGNTSATEVVLEDEVPANTTGDGPVRVDFGEIGGGGRAETAFQVVIDNPIAAGVREIRNQGKVTSHELPEVLTDDPTVGGNADETVTVVSAAPALRVEKTASLSEDVDGDKAVSQGDALLYRITITNTGNTAATEVVLSDPIADHISIVAGTVQTSQGTVTSESPMGVNLGALATGVTATITFQVRIDEGFPATEVANQAVVDSHELDPIQSDDPATPEKPDATRTTVLHKPEASIGDASVVEGDAGLVLLRLPVTLSKPSGREIRIDFATVPGTATAGADYDTVSGTLVFAAGETSHTVDVPVHGDFFLEPDESLSVDLSNPAGASIAQGHGTGTIQNDDEPAVLVAAKTAELAVDHDGNGVPSPGDEIGYRITVSNAGGSYATAIILSDDVPLHTRLVAGSVAASFGTVASQSPVRVEIVRLAPAETSTITFRVVVDNPIAAGVREIRNQGKVTCHELPEVLTDDPTFGGNADETVTAVSAAPVLRVEKTASLSEDVDGDKAVSEGDALLYRITITNTGNTAATEVMLSDPIADHVSVVAGSVQTSQGTVTSQSPVGVNLGALAAGVTATVSFKVRIDESFPATVVSNQATVDSHELDPIQSDDPATPEKPDATRTTVLHKPEVSIEDASVVEGNSGLVMLRLPVTLSRTTGRAIRIDFATVPDTATAGADYDAVSGTVVFAAGETSHMVEVPVHGDVFVEPDETLLVDLSNPIGATIADGHAVGTIRDDEICPGPELLVNGGGELKASGSAILGWQASQGSWQRRTANPAPAEGTGYLSAGAETPAELWQAVSVAAYAERIASGGQIFRFSGKVRTASESPSDVARILVEYRDTSNTVVLDAFDTGEIASPGEWRQVLDERPVPAGTGWIRVVLKGSRFTEPGNDAYFDALSLVSLKTPVLTIGDVEVYEGTSGTTPAVFPVRLSCPVSSGVETTWATADNTAIAGQDYLAASGSISFAPGTTAAFATVQVLGDTVHERHETFKVVLSPVAGVALVDPLGLGTIVNDDFCARSPGFWKTHQEVWPVSSLTIGAVEYNAAGMLALLSYSGPDSSNHLARQLVATELNLRVGSDPIILPVVSQAHEILIAWPPGSKPVGAVKDQVDALKNQLDAYNNPGCTEVPVIPGN